MIRTITAALAVVAALAVAAPANATPRQNAVPVNPARFASVQQWDVRSHVMDEFHRGGQFVASRTDAEGRVFHSRMFAGVGGATVLVTFYRDGGYGWVLWDKSWYGPQS